MPKLLRISDYFLIIVSDNKLNNQLLIHINNFKNYTRMTNIELAKWLHDNYEAVAKEQDWNTQQSCKVEFDTLPDANKRTMIEIADRLLNFNLLRLHFVIQRTFTSTCNEVENMAVEIDQFISQDALSKPMTYSRKLRQYLADKLNEYVG